MAHETLIGIPAIPVLPDMHGAPRWPVGSMTHCAGYRVAATRARELCGVGIDAEPHAALPDAILDLVLRGEEQARMPALAEAYPDRHWDRIMFCAKAAVPDHPRPARGTLPRARLSGAPSALTVTLLPAESQGPPAAAVAPPPASTSQYVLCGTPQFLLFLGGACLAAASMSSVTNGSRPALA